MNIRNHLLDGPLTIDATEDHNGVILQITEKKEHMFHHILFLACYALEFEEDGYIWYPTVISDLIAMGVNEKFAGHISAFMMTPYFEYDPLYVAIRPVVAEGVEACCKSLRDQIDFVADLAGCADEIAGRDIQYACGVIADRINDALDLLALKRLRRGLQLRAAAGETVPDLTNLPSNLSHRNHTWADGIVVPRLSAGISFRDAADFHSLKSLLYVH
jgi:hypothetical protein